MPRSRRTRKPKTPRQSKPSRPSTRPAAEQVPSPSVLSGMMARLLALEHVTGVFVGRKVRGGEEDGLALCCFVDQKLPKRQLPESVRIPPRLEWFPTSRRRRLVKTDVLETRRFERSSGPLALGPGDAVTHPGLGTVGMVMEHPRLGRVVVSAGHVFTNKTWTGTRVFNPGSGPRVSLMNVGGTSQDFEGELLKVTVTEAADYALVRPLDGQHCQNTFRDETPLDEPYLPAADDIGKKLLVLSHAGRRSTEFVGGRGQIQVGPQGVIRNVLITRAVTEPGDSGSCLVGLNRRVWGLLVGSNEHFSVFMQAAVPLSLEKAEFA